MELLKGKDSILLYKKLIVRVRDIVKIKYKI